MHCHLGGTILFGNLSVRVSFVVSSLTLENTSTVDCLSSTIQLLSIDSLS